MLWLSWCRKGKCSRLPEFADLSFSVGFLPRKDQQRTLNCFSIGYPISSVSLLERDLEKILHRCCHPISCFFSLEPQV